jgi:hypothetical protein
VPNSYKDNHRCQCDDCDSVLLTRANA